MKVKSKFGIVLTIVAGIGMIATIVITAKKAPEAQKKKEEALEKKRQETGNENASLTFMESFQAQAGCYAPVIASATLTVGSIIGSQILPQSAINDLEKLHKTYKEVTAKVNGPEAEKLIDDMTQQKLSQDNDTIKKELFVLKFGDEDILFESTLLDISEHIYDVNRFFKGTGTITFNELLDIFQLDHRERGDEFGWDECLGEAWYGYCWIDFKYRKGMLGDKPVTFIDMPFDCHPLTDEGCEEELNAVAERTSDWHA